MKKLTLMTLIGLSALATGAKADVLPGPVLPDQVSKTLSKPRVTQLQSTGAPVLNVKKPVPPPIAKEAEKITFKLHAMHFVGNHVYQDKDFQPFYQSKLGKVISVADLFAIVQSITNFYRNNGYILSQAVLPPQKVQNGDVKVQIVEGYINQVNVQGKPHGSKSLVKELGDNVVRARPLSVKTLEKYLLIANEIPGTVVKSVLSPSKTHVGAADLTLVTQTQTITSYLSYDNYGTRYLGPQQVTGNLGVNSFFLPGDSTQMTVTKTTKGGELSYGDINYSTAIDHYGDRFQFGYTITSTYPQFILTPFNILGNTANFYTMLQFPMMRTLTSSWTLRTGFNYLDTNVTSIPNNSKLYTDHVRSLDFGTTYLLSDRFRGSNQIVADIRQGLPIFGYTSDTSTSAETSNPGGHANYTKLAVQANRLQSIKGPFSLNLVATGQYSFVPLLASEQFGYGGSQLGRGYDPAEIIGSRGLAGSVELRYDWNISKYFMRVFQFYTFYDAGVIWNYKMSRGERNRVSATSAGVGARFYFTRYISGNIMWAQPLTKPVLAEQQQQSTVTNGQTVYTGNGFVPRVFFSIVASFA